MTRTRATAKQACAGCGGDLPPYVGMGQPRKFCTDECRSMARNISRRSPRIRILPDERFRAKLAEMPSGCIEWTGAKNGSGYGTLRVAGRSLLAHRFAYELRFGPIPEAAQALHSCDNPPCCNPMHLFLGSHDDNMRDRDIKGRTTFGTLGRHKYSASEVHEVLDLLRLGASHRQIHAQTGVSTAHISYIRNGKTRTKG